MIFTTETQRITELHREFSRRLLTPLLFNAATYSRVFGISAHALINGEGRSQMLRNMFRAGCIAFLLISGLASCHGQTPPNRISTTLSNCRPPPPLMPNVKPGVGGMTLSRDGKTLVIGGGDAKKESWI